MNLSALDVSIQAQIINLLMELQEGLKELTYIFIAHDLSVVKHTGNRLAVMYLGEIIEITGSKELYSNPLHPYTQALLSVISMADPIVEESRKRLILKGDVPSPINPPSGCSFHLRCDRATLEPDLPT
jgi:oligopeptide/dipeptide ABC transporter ATP-binding protein